MFGNKARDRRINSLEDEVAKLRRDTAVLTERNIGSLAMMLMPSSKFTAWRPGLVDRVSAIESHLKIDVQRVDGTTAKWVAKKMSANAGNNRRSQR